ncbi:MAG: (5-formylfuran-3-yl)methyl phosphate synthase [Candidatus Syntropharchaeia archaeon]
MKLLVSPRNVEEAKAAVRGGSDIIDVKNPNEGSLGANFPWVIRSIRDAIGDVTMSATIGDFDYKPGTASLAALGAALSGAEYIKVGLKVKEKKEAEEIIESVVRSVKGFYPEKKVVSAAYSDYERFGTISPLEIPEIAENAGADVVMVDTGIKDGRSTLEFLSEEDLNMFISDARKRGMKTALAGSLTFGDIPTVIRINPDIIGVRGIVCGGNRNSEIREELVRKLREMLP